MTSQASGHMVRNIRRQVKQLNFVPIRCTSGKYTSRYHNIEQLWLSTAVPINIQIQDTILWYKDLADITDWRKCETSAEQNKINLIRRYFTDPL